MRERVVVVGKIVLAVKQASTNKGGIKTNVSLKRAEISVRLCCAITL